jgi:HK97 gp10 family phage protein
MDDFTFSVPNLAQYEQHLLEMGTKVARSIGRSAARQGANVITAEARRLAVRGHPQYPNKITGVMAKSIRTHDRGIQGDNIIFGIEVTKRAFYARFVEFGTSHAQAYPFFRPATDGKAKEAVVVMATYMGKRIEASWSRPL